MTVEIEWSLDYCLACDKQTSGGVYCCQNCRLADLETSAHVSEPTSPTTPKTCRPSASSSGGAGLRLSPSFDFAVHRTPELCSSSLSARSQAKHTTSYFSIPATAVDGPNQILSPSSSRSSLSSTSGKPSQSWQVSAQARTELRGYSNSFDLIRNWRRSMTTPWSEAHPVSGDGTPG